MAAGTNLEDFFQAPDFHLPGIPLGDWLREYGQLADDVWAWATPLVATYVKTAQETWKTYTETHLKRFESLSSDDQRRFMNSGLDGAVVFLLLTTIARLILTKSLEPYLLQYFHQGQGHGFSCSFNQLKWLFASSMLSAIWHANSHTFFDRGVLVDVSLLLGTASVLSYMVYRQSSSVKACFAFFAVPALVLFPVSFTVAVMQHGPYIIQPKMFPALLAVVTAITAVYFIFEAPPTPVVKSGHAVPFGTALRQELEDLWHGSTWRRTIAAAPNRLADTVVHGPQNLRKRVVRASSKALRVSGEQVTDFVTNHEESGRQVIRAAAPVLQLIFTPIYHFFEGLVLFLLGLVYRLNKFLCYIYGMVIGAVTAGLYRRPGLARFLPHRQPPDVNHPVFDGAAAAAVMHNERLASEEPSRSRSRSTTPTASVAAKFSRRVSRSRHNDEDGKDSSTTPPPPRERRPRRKY